MIAAPLEAVWAFHEDVRKALPALSPPARHVRIESADLPVHVGSVIIIRARGPLWIPLRWVARIAEHQPPDARGAAVFVDEQVSGPFAAWRHEHRFQSDPAGGTRMLDRVTYRVPLGPLGRLANAMFVRRQLDEMFAYRHGQTRERLERSAAVAVGGAV